MSTPRVRNGIGIALADWGSRCIMPSDYEQIASEIKPEEVAANAIETLSQLYADRTHFLYELVQNADDVNSPSLAFRVDDGSITAWNKGRTFNPRTSAPSVPWGRASKT